MKSKYLIFVFASLLCSCSPSLKISSDIESNKNESSQESSSKNDSSHSIDGVYEYKRNSAFFKLKLKSIIDEPISYTSYMDATYINYVVGVFQVEDDYYKIYKNLRKDIYIPFSTEYSLKTKEKTYLIDSVKTLLKSYDTFYVYADEIVEDSCDITIYALDLFKQLPLEAIYSVIPSDIRFGGKYVFPVKDNKLKIDEVNKAIEEQNCEIDSINIYNYSDYFYNDMNEEDLVKSINSLYLKERKDV